MAASRRRTVALIFMILALGFAVVATVVISLFFGSLESRVAQQQLSRQQELVQVVIAASHVEQGTTLLPEHLDQIEVPRMFFLDTMVSDPESIVGLVVQERTLEGEPVRVERLAKPESGTGLNALIPEGQRALQVNLQGASAVAGFVTPGDYVDILFTGEAKLAGGRGLSKLTPGLRTTTLLQSKRILAIDDLLSRSATGISDGEQSNPSVTLAVSPREAQQITHAMQTGRLTLTLRNHVDATEQEVHGVAPGTFIGASSQRRTVAQMPKDPEPARRPARTRPETTPTTPARDPHQTLIIEGGSVRTVEDKSDD